MSPDREQRALRHRDFYRELDRLVQQIDRADGLESMLTQILESLKGVLDEQVGISSGRLYREEGEEFVIVKSFGAKGKELLGVAIPHTYGPVQELLPDKVCYFGPDDQILDRAIEDQLGVESSGAFYVGLENQYIAAFGIEADADFEEVRLALGTLRHAIQHRVKQLGLEGQIREARSIQVSLLPQRPPDFPGYEIAGHSIPAEQVGGDIFDFVPIDSHLLGIAVGDASGHGLPAALQARDVVTGLRMGVQHDLKITAVCGKLNRVIHRSGLTSRFVSLFYGELEKSGNFVFVNAGHESGILLRADGTRHEMRSTGIVMGPVEHVEYRRDLVALEPGDVVLLYTDGVVERNHAGEEYTAARLEATVRDRLRAGMPLSEIPAAVLEDAFAFGGGKPWADDATVVLVRRSVP